MPVNIGDKFTLGEGQPGIANSPGYQAGIGEMLSRTILPNTLMIAGIILFFLILFGGFTLITNAGNADKQKEGSQILTYSLIGFILVLSAYWIMQILGIITGFDLLSSPV